MKHVTIMVSQRILAPRILLLISIESIPLFPSPRLDDTAVPCIVFSHPTAFALEEQADCI